MCAAFAEKEIINVVGSLLLHRIQSMWYPFCAEKQSIGLICRLTLSIIRIKVSEFLLKNAAKADDAINNNKKKNREEKK